MFGSQILEVVIGIIFVYLLISIICSAIREGIEAWLKSRAAYLEHGIRELLHDKEGTGLAKSFYKHPLIYSLFSEDYTPGKTTRPSILASGKNLPTYIPSKNFALALMDIAARGPETDVVSSDPGSPIISLDTIRTNILNIGNPAVQRVLLTAIDSAQGDINKAQASIEAWYNSSMDRVSGWYKRSTHWIIFLIALVVVSVLNVNTITIVHFLYKNEAARAAVVAGVETAVKDPNFPSSENKYEKAKESLNSLDLPMGWSKGWGAPNPNVHNWSEFKTEIGGKAFWNNLFAPILGLLLTAFAATLGAPFWFDMLNKVMVIRSTVKPHEKSLEEGSEDRQTRSAQPATTATATEMPSSTAGNAVAGTAPQPLESLPNLRDDESSVDGCDVEIKDEDTTSDEDLPPAEGGVV